jgi:hypothetical protein
VLALVARVAIVVAVLYGLLVWAASQGTFAAAPVAGPDRLTYA